jgi:hypothetical protein
LIGEGEEKNTPPPLHDLEPGSRSDTGRDPGPILAETPSPPSDTGRGQKSILAGIPVRYWQKSRLSPPRPILAEETPSDTGRDQKSILAEEIGLDSILATLENRIETGETTPIEEGRRVHFFPGKRKLRDGRTKKTGHIYWEWAFRDPETGKRRRPYGGTLDKLPGEYRFRIGEYLKRRAETEGSAGSSGALTESFFRSIRLEVTDHSPREL